MEKTFTLQNGQQVRMKASAFIPKLYRARLNRDIIKDISSMQQELENLAKGEVSAELTEIVEDIAWAMCYHADSSVGSIENWLESIDSIFGIYEFVPFIFEMWGINTEQLSTPVKK